MRPNALFLGCLVVVTLLLDGCASMTAADDAPSEIVSAAANPLAPAVVAWNQTREGVITGVGAGATVGNVYLCCLSAHQQGESIQGAFPVGVGTVRIVVALRWDDPRVDLDLLVAAPDYEFFLPPELNPAGPNLRDSRGFSRYDGNGTLGQPDGLARIEVTDLAELALAGEWTWEVRSKTALSTPFRVNVIVEEAASS